MRSVEVFLSVEKFDGYRFETKINATRPADIPDEVIDFLRKQVAPAADFLRREFCDEFNSKIK